MPTGIEWCDETLNPQGWGCYGPGGTPERPQRCWYCYVERQAKGPYVPDCELCRQLIPHWHQHRPEKARVWKRPRRIFWQSMGDLFHPCSPTWQIEAVLKVAKATPQHTHIFCTKNPARYQAFNPWPGNCWLLTTITGLGDERGRINDLLRAEATVLGVSLEPLLGPVDLRPGLIGCYFEANYRRLVADCGGEDRIPSHLVWNGEKPHCLRWLIIGAYTGKGASRFVPAAAWVQSLIDQGRDAGVPVFLKDNLKWPSIIQEWPT